MKPATLLACKEQPPPVWAFPERHRRRLDIIELLFF
nr:MAG TPA: hypothetical protein [Caudoviricetes sp.]